MNVKRLSIALIVPALLLAACGAATPQLRQQGQKAEATVAAQVIEKPVEEAKRPAPGAVGGEGAAAYPAPAESLAAGNPVTGLRMVIKDAEIELLVDNTDLALSKVTQMTSDYGGYVISSQSWLNGEYQYATVRIGVPSDTFEAALNYLRNIGLQVLKETASGQDVSAEYADLQARLTNLEATAARVRSFLDAAQTVEEALQVNQTLSQLEGEIEQIKGQMKYYEGRSAFSTITVTLTPQIPTPTPAPTPTPTPAPGWNPGQTFGDASTVLVKLFQGLVDVLIWLIVVFGPFVLVGGLALWLGMTLTRRLRRKS